jgi:ATP synthase protein I
MPEQDSEERRSAADAFSHTVGSQETRKLRARRSRSVVWAGLGTLGVIGWSVGAPTLLGALLGLWIDRRHPGTRSWTLVLLSAGLFVGCANAWHWIAREQSEINRRERDE